MSHRLRPQDGDNPAVTATPPSPVQTSTGLPTPSRGHGLGARLRRMPVAFPLAMLAAAAMLLISEFGYRQSSEQLDRLVRMGQMRVELLRVRGLMADAESSQRGYLLIGRAAYLDPYRQAQRSVEQRLDAMKDKVSRRRDVVSQARLHQLERLIHDKFDEMQATIDLHDQGRQDAALASIQLDRGRVLMDQIDALAAQMTQHETHRIGLGLASVYETLMLNRVGITSMLAISVLVLGLYLRQRRTNDRQRAQQQRLIQSERDSLEVRMQERTRELVELTRHLETTREDERSRLARELHDELGALLTAAKLDVARIRPKLQSALPDLMPRLNHLVETLNSGIALKRRIIEDLRPSTLAHLGLKAALDGLCQDHAERSGLPVHTEIEDLPLSASSALTAYRLVQESLTNIGKYAKAGRIEVRMVIDDGFAHLSVRDDGVGFDPAQVGAQRHGLLGMRYRVQAESGRLQIHSARNQGTTIEAWLPLEA